MTCAECRRRLPGTRKFFETAQTVIDAQFAATGDPRRRSGPPGACKHGPAILIGTVLKRRKSLSPDPIARTPIATDSGNTYDPLTGEPCRAAASKGDCQQGQGQQQAAPVCSHRRRHRFDLTLESAGDPVPFGWRRRSRSFRHQGGSGNLDALDRSLDGADRGLKPSATCSMSVYRQARAAADPRQMPMTSFRARLPRSRTPSRFSQSR